MTDSDNPRSKWLLSIPGWPARMFQTLTKRAININHNDVNINLRTQAYYDPLQSRFYIGI